MVHRFFRSHFGLRSICYIELCSAQIYACVRIAQYQPDKPPATSFKNIAKTMDQFYTDDISHKNGAFPKNVLLLSINFYFIRCSQ